MQVNNSIQTLNRRAESRKEKGHYLILLFFCLPAFLLVKGFLYEAFPLENTGLLKAKRKPRQRANNTALFVMCVFSIHG